MSNEELNQVEDIFHAVLERAPTDRSSYLVQLCHGNQSLFNEVSSLISALENDDGFIEESAKTLTLKVLAESPEQSLVNQVIGPYRVLSRLGKGGMGEVYLAEDTRLARKVALKFISQEFVGDQWAKRQLIKEAQAVAMLDHPNICPVYGIEEVGEHTFIVMQYVEGTTLADSISENSLLSTEQVLTLARQMIGALTEAHSHAIIHRDVKPRNIMVAANGQLKVLDFGLAKSVKHHQGAVDESISQLKQNGVVAGTVAYMSPEQLRGDRLDFRTDIFSAGAVLYELMENKKLFARQSEAETISAILTEEMPPLTKIYPEFPQLERIIRKCVEKDREKRYPSANEVLLDLSQPAKARPGFRLLKPVVLACCAILLFAAAIIFLNRKTQRDLTPATPSQSAPAMSIKVAVLPVEDPQSLAADSLKDGFVESLIDRFAGLKNVNVAPYTTVSGYRDKLVKVEDVGKSLAVEAVLVGRIAKSNGQVTLQSKLLKTIDGSEIWVGEQPLNWSSVLQVEESVSKSVAASLQMQVEDQTKFMAAHGTSSSEAFRQYMTGRYYWRNRDVQKMNLAIGNFRKAIELDPAYAKAWAGLADCYVLQSTVAFGKSPTEESMNRAAAAAKEALDLNPNLAEAHTSIGVVNLRFNFDVSKAESELKHAIELDRSYAPAHYWYSHVLLILGRPAESESESLLAKKLDPTSIQSSMNYCRILSNVGKPAEAIDCYTNLLAENPGNGHIEYLRALVYLRSGRTDEAIKTLEAIYSKDKALAGAGLGYAYGKAGRFEEAQKVLSEMTQLAKQRYVPPQEFAIIYVGLNDHDNAFLWLEKSYDEKFAGLIYFTVEPIFSNLRSDPRYNDLVSRLNIPKT